MPFAPLPSSEEIIRMHEAGELGIELTKYHERPDGDTDPFFDHCVQLHNDGKIDLIGIPCEPGFAAVTGHNFFTAQHFYLKTIPLLKTDAFALMECCRVLIEKAGSDGAAGMPNGAFRKWCRNNPSEGARVIREARSGSQLARQFVTFAMQAADSLEEAVGFVRSFNDDRRLCAMAALGGMTLTEPGKVKMAMEALEPHVASAEDDDARANALVASFDVLKQRPDEDAANRLVVAASKEPGPATLNGLARVIWQHPKLLSPGSLETALRALENVQAEHSGTVRILDMALSQVLGTLLLQGILREKIMPKAIRSHFQKSVAMVDEPDIAFRHFARLVKELSKLAVSDRSRVRVARQIYIAVWVLFVWARDIDNLESPYQASEFALLHIWNLVRPHIGKKSNADKAIVMVLTPRNARSASSPIT